MTDEKKTAELTPEDLTLLAKLHMLCGFHAGMFVASRICAEHFPAADAVGDALRAALDDERARALKSIPEHLQGWAWECANQTEIERPKR